MTPMQTLELTETNYHRLLKRQIRKSLPPDLAEHPDIQDFLLAVNQAYTEYQDDLSRMELILEQSSGELFKANRELSRIAQEKTEEAALTSKRLEEVVGSISEVLVQLDRDGNFTYLNQAWESITGYPVSASMGQSFAGFFPTAEAREKVTEILSQETEGKEETLRIYTVGGQEKWLGVSLTPYFSNGQHIGFTGTLADVTARVTAETKLKSYTRDLERINAELDQFAYVVSHDLKAPLRAINNLSEWIEEDIADMLEGETKDQFRLLRGRVHRMENLINGILSYSRAGRMKTVKEKFVIRGLVDELCESFSTKKPLSFSIEGDASMEIEAEKIALTQILQNLVSNGIKYNDKDEIRISVGWKDLGKEYEFHVGDNGPGISPEFHERIFVIFQTLQARDEVESTGVGLAIVKKILDEKHSKIRIDSVMGVGTTFYFTWPKNEAKDI
ncbi:sensor histidine kinase [Dyadobacter fermentans]|uniref:histidine kinase n=1 Tax=Dyadobacter fermentans (strain ATCC 700827 / DSM 18053 / CIP 107007 / KCTC 52180 / NS114) TaxID=471854 RepID=C6VS13_DYAFD|nr:ATP-binding protein [Dyadobacter fermentans]ACT94534.1 PAS/PAC sensor signal transduction histidine kinase [Dyadobacter fermentans DSM 18053]